VLPRPQQHPKKIIVLGAGVIGVTTTYYLARDGHRSR
jgi:glycine/D-amino acid oxidase-like deaminating enzyme